VRQTRVIDRSKNGRASVAIGVVTRRWRMSKIVILIGVLALVALFVVVRLSMQAEKEREAAKARRRRR
jgi:hypothetical protein